MDWAERVLLVWEVLVVIFASGASLVMRQMRTNRDLRERVIVLEEAEKHNVETHAELAEEAKKIAREVHQFRQESQIQHGELSVKVDRLAEGQAEMTGYLRSWGRGKE